MRQNPPGRLRPSASAASPPGNASLVAADKQARTAKRQWLEQAKLLQQRAALLGKEFLPQAALAEHGLAEAVAPVLADVASLARARAEEAVSLARQRQRAAELSARFGDLVKHIGAGGEFIEELRQAMEGAEAEIAALRARHAMTLEMLAQEERETDAELEALARRFEGWTSEDAAAAATAHAPFGAQYGTQNGEAAGAAAWLPNTAPNSVPNTAQHMSPSTVTAHRVRERRAGVPAAGGAEGTPSPPPACGLADTATEHTPSPEGSYRYGGGSGGGRRGGRASGGGSGGGSGGSGDGGRMSALHAEVAQLDAYLGRLGGASCGWNDEDHAAYLRLRTQTLGASPPSMSDAQHDAEQASSSPYKQQQQQQLQMQLIERGAREIPGHDLASVAAHEKALSEREVALERRRQLLQQWRAAKEADALAARAAAAQEVATTTSAVASRSVSRIGTGARGVGSREAEEARQRQLDEWRQRKMAEHEAKAQAVTIQKETAMRKQEEAQARHARIKEGLAARAMAREAEAASLRRLAERQKREAAAAAAHDRQVALLTMQQRDAEETERRKYAAALRAEERLRREERLRELAAAARPPEIARQPRDPERLLKTTRAATARKQETAQAMEGLAAAKDSRFGSSSLTFQAAGSRASVAWRQGL